MKYRFLRFPEGKVKAVTFSYDDGCSQDLRTAEVFDHYGLKGTFNINSANVIREKGLTAREIQEHILDKGHEVAVHGQLHRAPGVVRAVEGIRDILCCRLELEEMFGEIIRGLAYPDSGIGRFVNGASYEKIRAYLQELDIVYARTARGDNNRYALPEDWYCWMPTAHHDNPQVLDWAKEFVELTLPVHGSRKSPRLFYVWGHSFEFDRNDNWEQLTRLCEALAGRDDIWYATNMEICQYVMAYERLVYSADGLRVYNPSVQTVWFEVDGTPYRVDPGQTLTVADTRFPFFKNI